MRMRRHIEVICQGEEEDETGVVIVATTFYLIFSARYGGKLPTLTTPDTYFTNAM
jgi:hypothetical protein